MNHGNYSYAKKLANWKTPLDVEIVVTTVLYGNQDTYKERRSIGKGN